VILRYIHYRVYDGEKADIWSCGVILYAMLEGTLPFDHKSLTELFHQIKEANLKFNRTLSINAKDLVCKMLQPNPLKRISLEDIKSHPWFKKNLEPYLFDYKLIYSQDLSKIDQEIKTKVLELDPHLNKYDDETISMLLIDYMYS